MNFYEYTLSRQLRSSNLTIYEFQKATAKRVSGNINLMLSQLQKQALKVTTNSMKVEN